VKAVQLSLAIVETDSHRSEEKMSSDYIMKGISNIIWHIETNGKTLGAERTLEEVYKSLKNMLNDYNS
jgi:hypothetical protein